MGTPRGPVIETLPAYDRDPDHEVVRRKVTASCRQKRLAGVAACAEDVVKLHCAGMPLGEIARETGIDTRTVHEIVAQHMRAASRRA